MQRHILIIFVLTGIFSWSQDYSRKPFASIHQYAERIIGARIVESKTNLDPRKGLRFYYKEKDLPGNFVHVSGGYSGDYFLSMWKMKDGNDLIGVTHYNCQAFCIYECSFFSFSMNDSSDVTAEVLPIGKMEKHLVKMKTKVIGSAGNMDDEEAQYKFIMPHAGQLMEVQISMNRNKIEFPLLALEWTGDKFVVSVRYDEVPDF